MKYLFTSMIGIFVFDNQFNLVEHIPFKNLDDYEDRQKAEEKIKLLSMILTLLIKVLELKRRLMAALRLKTGAVVPDCANTDARG